MTDPKDLNATKLEELHRQPLTPDQQAIVDAIRREISSTIAWWVQSQFHLGNTKAEIWNKLNRIHGFMGLNTAEVDLLENTENLPHFDPSPIDSAMVDLSDVDALESKYRSDDEYDVPTRHTIDGGG